MVVYGDLLFLINFSMDFLCFYISCQLLHQKLPIGRTMLSSILGGIYSVASLFIVADKWVALLIDVWVLIFMCLLVYLKKGVSVKGIIKGIFLYFFVSALLGGLMTALFSLFNRIELITNDMGMNEGIDVWIFALLVLVGSFCTLKGGKIFRSSYSKKIVTLIMESEIGSVHLRALVDSGNLASEPISGKSVVFVSVEKCKKIIDNAILNSLNNISKIDEIPFDVLLKIRMIPTNAVSGKSFLPGIKFKRVALLQGKKTKELDVYVALVDGNNLSEYDAIISDETIV